MGKHTPTPWMLDPDSPLDILFDDRAGENVTPMIGCVFDANTDQEQAEADAAFIVHAVNCHDDMLEMLCKIAETPLSDEQAVYDNKQHVIAFLAKAEAASTRRDGPVLREGVDV